MVDRSHVLRQHLRDVPDHAGCSKFWQVATRLAPSRQSEGCVPIPAALAHHRSLELSAEFIRMSNTSTGRPACDLRLYQHRRGHRGGWRPKVVPRVAGLRSIGRFTCNSLRVLCEPGMCDLQASGREYPIRTYRPAIASAFDQIHRSRARVHMKLVVTVIVGDPHFATAAHVHEVDPTFDPSAS